jgi:putative membrane protein
MDFLTLKSLHIIFVITWFAGLFYIVRLFIYHTEAQEKPEPDKRILQKQYKLMSKRLWLIITWPSAILSSIFAIWMLIQNPIYLEMPWMHVKLGFVILLYIYHLLCHKIYVEFQKDIIKYSSNKLRIWNEVATIILFATVFLVVLKNAVNWIYGVIGLLLFTIVLMLGIKLYKRMRSNKSWEQEN